MKKIYMIPTTEIVNVRIETLLNSGSGTQSVTVTDTNYDSGEGEILSRSGSLWDDEE